MFSLGELFCGPGGIGTGAKLSGIPINHIWASDYDRDSCATYRRNMGAGVQVLCEDVKKLDFSKLPTVDALSFGFPCNDFSIVGEQMGLEGNFGGLYKHCVRAVQHFRPQWFIAENVEGIKNSNEGNAIKLILKEFFECGYHLYPHLYKFEEYGVPQKRRRVIIVGIRKDLPYVFKVPAPVLFRSLDVTVRTALANIPTDAPNNELTAQSKTVIERLKLIRPGQNAFNADLPKTLQLNVKGAKMSQIYRRLHPDQPSYTVTGSGGGGTHVYHYEHHRALTNRERARLQTFPDDFVFEGSKESVRKQIGMAVPPRGIACVFRALYNSFNEIEYPYIDCNIPFHPLLCI